MSNGLVHYFAMIIENGLTFYLSEIKPASSIKDQPWYGYMGPQQATRFKTKEEAGTALLEFSKTRTGNVLVGIGTVEYFKIKGKE